MQLGAGVAARRSEAGLEGAGGALVDGVRVQLAAPRLCIAGKRKALFAISILNVYPGGAEESVALLSER